tara:strand:+ start:345 stop:737 length:393 start_codon:yes stop_codon:yes gene_type:complete
MIVPGTVLVDIEPGGTVVAQLFPHSLQQARKIKKEIEAIGTLFDPSIGKKGAILYTKQFANPGGCIFVRIHKKTTPLLRLKAMTGLLLLVFAKCKAETMNIVIRQTTLRDGVLFDYDFEDIGIVSRQGRG